LHCRAINGALEGWKNLVEDNRARLIDQIVVWSMLEHDHFMLAQVRERIASLSVGVHVTTEELGHSLQRLDLAFVLAEDNGTYSWRVPLLRDRCRLQAPQEQLVDQVAKLKEVEQAFRDSRDG
jgi:hypothetical protein